MHVINATKSHSELIPYLFPSAIDIKGVPELFLCVTENEQNILGAGILCSSEGNAANSFVMDIVIIDESKRHRISTQLMQVIIHLATILKAPALQFLALLNTPIEKKQFQSAGFVEIRKTIAYSINIKATYEILDRFVKMLQASKSIPDNFQILSYSKFNTEALANLCQQEFGFLTHGHLKATGQYFDDPQWDFSSSLVIAIDNKLVAALAVGSNGKQAIFDPLLITPDKRSTWAFPLITQIVCKKLLEKQVMHGQALIHESNSKMMSFMKKISASEQYQELLFQKNLYS